MWVDRLEVDGFGRLRATYEFSPGLTVVTGPNESGKSTLHQATIRGMFGFTRSEYRRYGGTSTLSEWAPWTGPPFGLTAILRTDDRTLRATWAFDRDNSSQALKLIDEHTGDDLTEEVAEMHGTTALGRYLLNLDYEEFCQVCMLEQAAIGAVVRSDGLVDSLRRAVETGAAEFGVDHATELLGAALGGDQIGVRRDNLAALQTGRLGRSLSRREEIEGDLKDAAETQAELMELAQQLAAERLGEEELGATRLVVEQELLLTRAKDLEERTGSAREASEHAAFKPGESVRLDEEIVEQVATRFHERDRLAGQQTENEPRAEAARELVGGLEGKIADCAQRMREVEAYRTVDSSPRDEVTDLVARLQELRREPVATPTGEVASASQDPLWIAAAAAAIASLAGAAIVGPAALAGFLISTVLVVVALSRRRRVTISAQPRSTEERRSELAAQLQSVLDAAGVSPASDSGVRASAYLDACTKRAEHDGLVAEHAVLQRQAVEAAEPERDQRRLVAEAEAVDASIRTELQQLGIEAADLERARQEFESRVREAQESQRLMDKAEGASTALETALGGLTMEQLAQECEAAGQRLRENIAQHGELAREPGHQSALEGRLRDLNVEATKVSAEVGRLEARIAEREDALTSVPALRGERKELNDLVEGIRVAAEAISVARSGLEEAASEAHRRFAPILNAAIAQDLPKITGGRYETARISEELEITLEAPETGDTVDAEHLSRGTQDQIYLVERLAILGMLDTEEVRAPLLLDDVFVHFDEERLGFALELIAREAGGRQVILFGGDSRIPKELDNAGIEHEPIELALAAA